ncbi:23483_t:CDS:2, partial [Gigaspora margarita]
MHYLPIFQINDPTFQLRSYQQPTSSTSFNAKIDCVNNKFDERLNNESDELLYNESSKHLNNESNELLGNKSNKRLDNEPDERLSKESDKQLDNEFDDQVELYKEQIFKTVKEAYAVVEAFVQSNGFGIRKGRVKKDASNEHKISRTFLCCHARKPSNKKESHKIEKSGSYRTDYKWKVNIYWSKHLSRYYISTYVNVHTSHTLNSSTIKFIPKNCKLTNKMLEDIKYYTIVRKLNTSAQYRLLFGKYNALIH